MSPPNAPMQECADIWSIGYCPNTECTKDHSMLHCRYCNYDATSLASLTAHIGTTEHLARTRTEAGFPSGSRHQHQGDTTEGPAHSPGSDTSTLPTSMKTCELCDVSVPSTDWEYHCRSRRHKSAEKVAEYKGVLDNAERDKKGVQVEGSFDFGTLELSHAKSGASCLAKIKTVKGLSRYRLTEAKIQGDRQQNFDIYLPVPQTLTRRKTISVHLDFISEDTGQYEDRIEFHFLDEGTREVFLISRPIHATVVFNKNDHEAMRPKAPYVPRRNTAREPEKEVVAGPEPPETRTIPYIVPLPRADIPLPLATLLSTGTFREISRQITKGYLPPVFNSNTYGRQFKTLLWVEEYQNEQDLERYDIVSTSMGKHLDTFTLQVPGLAEKRPSILVGDRIFVQRHGERSGRWFEGRVFRVEREIVKLRFHASFPLWSPRERYSVRFKLTRVPFRRQHQAMDTVFLEDRVLFPIPNHLSQVRLRRVEPFNPLLKDNVRQQAAVMFITSSPPASVPFIIFGPPGTGKTITAIEAIRQVLSSNPESRIVACAPSNSAADLLVMGLTSLAKNELFRLYAPSRSHAKNDIDHRILEYTYVDLNGHFSTPPLETMKGFRIVVTTCVSASVLLNIGIRKGYYTHIFIDEAGQATEPEAIMSVKTLADTRTNVILSGDPQQLGPVIRSTLSREFGLELSYLERLMKREIYQFQSKEVNPNVVQLVQNYRSHSAILKYPNETFYDSQLRPYASKDVTEYYLNSDYLPNKTFPIVFYAVHGQDEREASSPSVFNRVEVLKVKEYVEKLKADRTFRTTDQDIGVIAPYHAQCLKIRSVLRPVAEGVKVGSVEEFQGQERKVVIISTVRSSKESLDYDLRHTLGFVASPRRFNVAITRAKSMLIIVGDPRVLSLDPLWRKFLNHIYLNGGWTGPAEITWDPDEEVDERGGYDERIRKAVEVDMKRLARRMEAMKMVGLEDGDIYEAEEDVNVDRPWNEWE